MSDYYRGRRTTALYEPGSPYPFKLSRSRIEKFMNCPRCFYIDRRLGLDTPPGFPFSLNSAVDKLLKKEFDIHRAKGTKHPLQENYGIDAIPMAHELIDEWRNAFHGVQYLHPETNFLIFGGIDDVWQDKNGKLIIVDYKSTSKDGEISLDAEWQDSYKRQMEIYQWLFSKNGYDVSKTGYFVYCNGMTDKEAFDAKLEFNIKLIPYEGDYSWIDETLVEIKNCLEGSTPEFTPDCDYCTYNTAMKTLS
ncbi:MAG TPA: PD-(D/E)XK nuclease family protein [Patescibacteria group bacterium]|nr:PD-(D/E)XK nuclease family protein [Patescibacteria group bacterium]